LLNLKQHENLKPTEAEDTRRIYTVLQAFLQGSPSGAQIDQRQPC
jgi:hypothetical protein